MRTIQAALIALCLCTISASFVPKSLVKKYAMVKIAESCVGRETLEALKQELMDACEKCHGAESPDLPAFRQQMSEVLGMEAVDAPHHPAYSLRSSVQYVPVPALHMPPITYQYQRRWRRSSFHGRLTAEKLEMMKQKLTAMIGNMTCVMRELKMIDANNQVDFASIKKRVMELPVSKELMDDMCEAVDTCRDFSSCLPSSLLDKSPITMGFGRQIAFFKCFKDAKLEACMKSDFRQQMMPELMRSGLEVDGEEGFQTLILSAMLAEGF